MMLAGQRPLRLGALGLLRFLEAQQQLFPAETSLAQTRRDRLVAVVNLYRALGGGWEAEEEAASVEHPHY